MALRFRGLGLLGLCLVVVVFAAAGGIQAKKKEEVKKEFVITLDHSNFSDTVSKHDFIVVEFYAPWCGHCKKLTPEYEKAASVLSKHDPPITLAKMDASNEVNKEIAEEYQVQGFPTIKVLRNGGKDIQDYKGPREADGIVQYIKKQLGPASVEIKSAKDAANVIDEKKIFIVGLFPKFEGEEYENFTKLAEKLRSDYEFGHTLDAKLLPKGDLSVTGPIIRLLKPFDDLFSDFEVFELEAAQKFIEVEDMPSVVVFDQEDQNNLAYLGKVFSSESTKVTMLLNFSGESEAVLKSKFHDIASLLKGGNLSFVIGDLEKSQPLMQYFKLEASQTPLVFIQKSGNKKYLKANVEPDQLVPWFKKFLDDKVEPFVISQPIPKENNEPVKVVVLDSLQDMVLKSGKEVFLEFYAPWCGHCKQIAPILDEVAVSYEKDPNVMIAKFDATANDAPTDIFDVQGFPTMFFISSKGKIIEYSSGDRSKEDIINFIEENRSDKEVKSEINPQEKKKKKSDAVKVEEVKGESSPPEKKKKSDTVEVEKGKGESSPPEKNKKSDTVEVEKGKGESSPPEKNKKSDTVEVEKGKGESSPPEKKKKKSDTIEVEKGKGESSPPEKKKKSDTVEVEKSKGENSPPVKKKKSDTIEVEKDKGESSSSKKEKDKKKKKSDSVKVNKGKEESLKDEL